MKTPALFLLLLFLPSSPRNCDSRFSGHIMPKHIHAPAAQHWKHFTPLRKPILHLFCYNVPAPSDRNSLGGCPRWHGTGIHRDALSACEQRWVNTHFQFALLTRILTDLHRTNSSEHLRCPTTTEYHIRERRHLPRRRQWKELYIRLCPYCGGKMRCFPEGKRCVVLHGLNVSSRRSADAEIHSHRRRGHLPPKRIRKAHQGAKTCFRFARSLRKGPQLGWIHGS